MSWWDSYRAGYRGELMAGALEFADMGWSVLPGTFWQSNRWTGIPNAPQGGPVPAAAEGLAAATRDRAAVTRWWSGLPYTVLVATGSVVDVIEVPASVGRRVCARLWESGVMVPVGATPTGRWWFAVRSGEALRPELASRSEVILHGPGSWVVAPPSESAQGSVQWRIPPSAGDGSLPDTYDVQVALLDVLAQRAVLVSASAGFAAVATGVHSWT